MANYYTHFSFTVPFQRGDLDEEGNERNVDRIVDELIQHQLDALESDGNDVFGEDEMPYGLSIVADGPGVWISDDGDSGSAVSAIAAVRWLLDQPGAPERAWFEWANTCSKPRLDAFGGGAAIVTRGNVLWMDTYKWLAETLADLSSYEQEPAIEKPAIEAATRYFEVTCTATADITETWLVPWDGDDEPDVDDLERLVLAGDARPVDDRVDGNEQDRRDFQCLGEADPINQQGEQS